MLYLVATPIGNLGDITLRALEILRSVDMVASEDTRKTGFLLKHFDIRKPQMAFQEHNEDRAGERIMGLLAEGKSVAVVTEAGTPGISDPGYHHRAARHHGRRRGDNDSGRIRGGDGPGALRAAGSQLHLPRVSASQTRSPAAISWKFMGVPTHARLL